MTPLEKEFENAMLDIDEVSSRHNYYPTYFIRLVKDLGGVGAAKHLLAKPGPQEGLFKLWEIGRLDISMEAIVLQDRFRSLFSEFEIHEARRRLTELGYFK